MTDRPPRVIVGIRRGMESRPLGLRPSADQHDEQLEHDDEHQDEHDYAIEAGDYEAIISTDDRSH